VALEDDERSLSKALHVIADAMKALRDAGWDGKTPAWGEDPNPDDALDMEDDAICDGMDCAALLKDDCRRKRGFTVPRPEGLLAAPLAHHKCGRGHRGQGELAVPLDAVGAAVKAASSAGLEWLAGKEV